MPGSSRIRSVVPAGEREVAEPPLVPPAVLHLEKPDHLLSEKKRFDSSHIRVEEAGHERVRGVLTARCRGKETEGNPVKPRGENHVMNERRKERRRRGEVLKYRHRAIEPEG